jgi:hypothetical protein
LEVSGAVEELEAAPDASSVANRVTFPATAQEEDAVALEGVEAAGRDVLSVAKMGTSQGIAPREEIDVKRKFL